MLYSCSNKLTAVAAVPVVVAMVAPGATGPSKGSSRCYSHLHSTVQHSNIGVSFCLGFVVIVLSGRVLRLRFWGSLDESHAWLSMHGFVSVVGDDAFSAANCPVRLADKPWLKVLLADLL